MMLLLICSVGIAVTGETEVDACGLRGWNADQDYQYVALGMYPYYADGTEMPVLWQVLAVEDGKALLYTTYSIDSCQPVWVEDPNIANKKTYRRLDDYGESDMNIYLNETMLPKLLGDEPVLKAVTEEQYGRIYPLTDKELMTEHYGFPNMRFWAHTERQAFATPYTLSIKLHPRYGSKVFKDPSKGTSPYWTASLKYPKSEFMHIVGCDGHLSVGTLCRTSVGLRVAIRLDTSRIQVVSGSGTIWDPCRLAYVENRRAEMPPERNMETPAPTTPKPRSGQKKGKATPAPEATPVPVPEWITHQEPSPEETPDVLTEPEEQNAEEPAALLATPNPTAENTATPLPGFLVDIRQSDQ